MNDKLNRRKFESLYEKQPPPAVWAQIEDQLEEKSYQGGSNWRTFLSAAAIFLIALSLWFWNQPGETATADAPQQNSQVQYEQFPESTMHAATTELAHQHPAQNKRMTRSNEKGESKKQMPTQTVVAEISNPSREEKDRVKTVKLPIREMNQLPQEYGTDVAKVLHENEGLVVTPLVKLPQAEMRIEVGQTMDQWETPSRNDLSTVAVDASRKPNLKFKGLTTTESALFIIKDELDHVADDVVMAGRRKLKNIKLQF